MDEARESETGDCVLPLIITALPDVEEETGCLFCVIEGGRQMEGRWCLVTHRAPGDLIRVGLIRTKD